MLEWQGRQIPEALAEIVDPAHTVVIMHDIQNDNTGPNGVFARDNRRIDVTQILGPIAAFLDEARSHGVRVMYTQVHQPAESRYLHRSPHPRKLRNREGPRSALASREQPLRYLRVADG